DFTPVATTELVMFAQAQTHFAQRDVKLFAMSTSNEPTGDGGYVSHEEWVKDVDDISLVPLKIPIINDRDGRLSHLYNILDNKDVHDLKSSDDAAEGVGFKSRTIFIIGPNKHFRLILNYPAAVGFNTAEVLRTIDCLQTAQKVGVRTPANWIPGSDVIIPPKVSDAEAKEKFPHYTALKPYLRFTPLPVKETNVEQINDISVADAAQFLDVSA
ncbi:Thioredoxin-like fold, partial [Elaphomyces granulatus]